MNMKHSGLREDWEVREVDGHIEMHSIYKPYRIPQRECVEFISASQECLYIIIANDEKIPTGMTYAQARERIHGPFTIDYAPSNWHVRATFIEPPRRCVCLRHPKHGVCYVPLLEGAEVPQTLDELETAAAAKPGFWKPQGEVAGELIFEE